MRSTGRYKYSVTQTLQDGVTLYAVLVQESLTQRLIQIPTLIVNGVVMRLYLLSSLVGHTIQHLTYLVGVCGVVDVPHGSWSLCCFGHSLFAQVTNASGIESS